MLYGIIFYYIFDSQFLFLSDLECFNVFFDLFSGVLDSLFFVFLLAVLLHVREY